MKLNEIIPWGRTLEEYQLMFNLSPANLKFKILGCGDGPASFNAEMTALGHSVISVDPLYQWSGEQIKQRVQNTYESVVSQVRQNSHEYVWNRFQNADELGQSRWAAMERFLLDYEAGKAEGRYQQQSLPHLAFDDHQFALGLCSHLLFSYSEHLSLEFHLDSITELLRVCEEVRIFPLINLQGELSPYLETVIANLSSAAFNVQVESVDYEFRKGGNQMLKIQGKSLSNLGN
ncbi:SAM-dependent methyltransferase [Laspinema olomoucense]|uniref:SAM-dependent methyltransferase n=1 Tax=Laspinema olomoucense D3b TaxID=2953688 RepID=A0ABT2N6W0_9CYAN|nr:MULTISPECIES: SAM-dependent methyltransferase [unclassified Laspinema]MCT7974025.1 SAM-dependent methyltransferase [Laspinema sp. D3d]MCT7978431.1 SAM-dependent methyltransferase [Laspinema sp. D3b]